MIATLCAKRTGQYHVAVAEHDSQAFLELFEAEPGQPTQAEVGEWVGLYTKLVDMLERQLDETREFAGSVPAAMRQYLQTDNERILTEELEVFRSRLQQ